MRTPPSHDGDVVLGEDWVAPETAAPSELRDDRARRSLISLRGSPLARKIITFNLIALNVLVAGILYLNSTRDSLAVQRISALVAQAQLVADVVEAQLPVGAPVNLATGDGVDVEETLAGLDLRGGHEVFVFDTANMLIAQNQGTLTSLQSEQEAGEDLALLTDGLSWLWNAISGPFASEPTAPPPIEEQLRPLVARSLSGETQVSEGLDGAGGTLFSVVTPIEQGGVAVGVVALTSASGEIDAMVRSERERVLQMFVIATLVSIGLSLVLASTIANPLSDLATAAELGRDKNARKVNPGRIRIPDLTARPDEIGRLSGALRSMVAALYERIEGNEQFAADVSHEIKNPLASLRSAVGTMRVARRDDQRERLLEVIEHDVKRLDRLVSDISNASRLDSELVKEEEESFDLINMLDNIIDFLGKDAKARGIDFVADVPSAPIHVQGLEGRLAQVFVNLITNAVSFCDNGDAIRVWTRTRENRVLVVVEDTGPGIPEADLQRVKERFVRLDDARTLPGSGLGLALVDAVAELHAGEFTLARGQDEIGLKATLILPAKS